MQVCSHFPIDLIQRCSGVSKVLEVGIGAGFDAERFCALGINYLGIDTSSAAVEITNERLEKRGYSGCVIRKDFFEFTLEEKFDLVFDRGVFHNQKSTELRRDFSQKCAQMLSPSGFWISIIGCSNSQTNTHHGGLNLTDAISAVENNFEIETCDRRRYGPEEWPDNFLAWYCLFKRR